MTIKRIAGTANNIGVTATTSSSTPVTTSSSVPADDTTTMTAVLTSAITFVRPTTTSSTSTSSSQTKTSSTSPGPGLPNLNISNGTCYAGPNMPMDSRFLPCGNAAAGVQSCCWQGDICLADHACFGMHDGGYNTYLAGCTDAQWNTSDPGVRNACPNKPAPYNTQPWIGLAFCGTTSSKDKNAWIACPQNNAPTTMLSAGPCVCPTVTQQRIVAFTDGATLGSYASLPRAAGGSMAWYSPYTPTYAATVTGAPTSAPTEPAGGGLSASNGTLPAASTSPTSTSLVIGVAAGVGGFVLLAVIATLTFCWSVKRKRKRTLATTTGEGEGGQYGDESYAVLGAEKQVPEQVPEQAASNSPGGQSLAVSELEIRPARPWSMRSELDGGTTSVVPGDPARAQTAHNHATRYSIGTLLSSPPNSPPLSGDLHESSTVSSLHGPLTGQTTGQTGAGGGVRSYHPAAPNFETLVELEG